MAVITVKNFAGGLTDFPIGANPEKYEQADNLVLDEYKKLINKPGATLDFSTDLARAQAASSASTRRISLMCAQTIGTARNFTALKIVGRTIQYDNGTTMTELTENGSAFVSGVNKTTGYSFAEWNNHTFITHDAFQKPVKIYNDETGALRLRTAGMPNIADTFTATGGSGAAYIYALVAKYTYKVGDVEFIDRGVPILKEFTNIGSTTPGANPGITVGSIPVLANGTGEHFDTGSIKIEVYRTTNSGDVLYFVGEVTNGTTTLADSTSDTSLINNKPLYTTNGVVENTRPPKCKYMHGTSDFVYYANGIEVGSTGQDLELLPQRVWQSKRGDPDSVPANFFADAEEPIVGISSVKSIPIIFCRNSIYRADGFYDDLGRGGIVLKKISDSIGAAGHLSLVQTLQGVFFAGNDGFYFTDGYQVIAISNEFKTTYRPIVSSELKRKRIYGALDTNEQLVIWAVSDTRGEAYDDDNSRLFVLDLKERQFTTWSSGYQGTANSLDVIATGDNTGATVTFSSTTGIDEGSWAFRNDELLALKPATFVKEVVDGTDINLNYAATNSIGKEFIFIDGNPNNIWFRNFLPTALLYANGSLYMGDRHGFTRCFDRDLPYDVWIDPSGGTTPANFAKVPLYFKYSSVFHDFGTTEFRKYVHTILVKARPRLDINAEMTLQVKGENDDSGFPHDLQEIYFQSLYPWGIASVSWGDPRLWRPLRTIIDVKRRFPASKLRCEYKQVTFEPAIVTVYRSAAFALATVANDTTNIKSLTLPGASVLPADAFAYYLAFENDNYKKLYFINERTSDTVLKFFDKDNTAPTGNNLKWVIKGYLKQGLINMLEYSIFHEVLGPSQQPYQGENAVLQ